MLEIWPVIARKINKIIATRCHILRLKCTKFDFGWGAPRPHWRSLQCFPRPLAGFKGPTSKGRGGKGKGEEEGGKRKRGEERGVEKEGEVKGVVNSKNFFQNVLYLVNC